MSHALLARQLSELVGEAHLREDPAACAPFALHHQVPALVVEPGSVEEVAQVVAAVAAEGMTVVPYGGGTRQAWGAPVASTNVVVVRTTRLNQVLIYEPDDLTISLQAGMTAAALNATLADNGQMFPLDVPLPHQSTIGGLLATAMDGPRRLGYGTSRDLLLGVQVVEASGRISKAGGMTVKNVSGYDLMKLYTGSLGTLAIIVAANFKLIPRPNAEASLLCSFATPEQAFQLIEGVRISQLTPMALEYVEGLTFAPFTNSTIQVALRTEGLSAAVERHLHELTARTAQAGGQAYPLHDEAHRQLWAQLNDLPQTATVADDELVIRLTTLPSQLALALTRARTTAHELGITLTVSARSLNGVAYLRARGNDEQLRTWHNRLYAHQPTTAVLGGPLHLRREMPAWGQPPTTVEVMRRIKHQFDPTNRLNPGRYVV
ncbi:FAD-binding oxidoreductase [Candidatus Chloroploca asiatica]|uniref:FAD-linked oxidase n=1 Tax=Candidatus Chloroploca asiatica TaxID=1506545 RepID=A0A2H3KKF9_9CHLR|nr:FAD-binding oxidoreductase [Candidatus Chloroploca asiatica]PDV98419.1 FAD-linked oxidase [Candidatus Chloroploca asiatica]